MYCIGFVFLMGCVMMAYSDIVSIIQNEDDLIGTCTETCGDLPSITNKFNCRKINNCRHSSVGWNRGFVRCDYCRCDCDRDLTYRDIKVTKEQLSATEPDIYDTCTETCDKSGLVRTSFRGCDEVRDCKMDKKGWTRGFVRCDYCKCTCIKKSSATQYKLENVKYDMSNAIVAQPVKPEVIATLLAINEGDKPQNVERSLTFTKETSQSYTTSKTLEAGLSMAVEAGVTIGFKATITTTSSITASKTLENGKTKTESISDSATAKMEVPAKSQQRVNILAESVRVDVPYSSTLVTTYKDGTTTRKNLSGTFTDVSLRKIRIQYEKAEPIRPQSKNDKNALVLPK